MWTIVPSLRYQAVLDSSTISEISGCSEPKCHPWDIRLFWTIVLQLFLVSDFLAILIHLPQGQKVDMEKISFIFSSFLSFFPAFFLSSLSLSLIISLFFPIDGGPDAQSISCATFPCVYYGPKQPRIKMRVQGYLLFHLLIPLHHSLACLHCWLCLRAPLCSFAYSQSPLTFWESESLGANLNHSAIPEISGCSGP